MSVVIPRWYQDRVVAEVAAGLEGGSRRIGVILPTGTGKTDTLALIAADSRVRTFLGATKRPVRVLLLSHLRALLTQARKTFDHYPIELRTLSTFDRGSIDEHVEWADMIFWDEAHHESAFTAQKKLEKLLDRPIVFTTATIDRPDRMIVKIDLHVEPMSREEAVDQGFLAPTDLVSVLDYSGLDKAPIIHKVMRDFRSQFGQTMVFVRTMNEVRDLEAKLIADGWKAVGITTQSSAVVDDVLDRFRQGKIDTIINCKKLSEGVNVPACDNVVIGRKVVSHVVINQAVGRGARPDSPCRVTQLVNPFNAPLSVASFIKNVRSHRVISWNDKNKTWDYTEI